jgi:hypothetical protein
MAIFSCRRAGNYSMYRPSLEAVTTPGSVSRSVGTLNATNSIVADERVY